MTFLNKLLGRRDSNDIVVAIELHSVDQIRAALDAGLNPRNPVRGKPLVTWLTEMYSRGDNFSKCLRLLLDRGAVLDDPIVAPVLLNDAEAVAAAIRADPSVLNHRTTMVSAFTPLVGASLLHVAAEYGHADVAQVLIDLGADVDATASIDSYGLNGHTPLFHHRQLKPQSLRTNLEDAPTSRSEDRHRGSRDYVGQGIRVGDNAVRCDAHLLCSVRPPSAGASGRTGDSTTTSSCWSRPPVGRFHRSTTCPIDISIRRPPNKRLLAPRKPETRGLGKAHETR